jgi:hypothetical protein
MTLRIRVYAEESLNQVGSSSGGGGRVRLHAPQQRRQLADFCHCTALNLCLGEAPASLKGSRRALIMHGMVCELSLLKMRSCKGLFSHVRRLCDPIMEERRGGCAVGLEDLQYLRLYMYSDGASSIVSRHQTFWMLATCHRTSRPSMPESSGSGECRRFVDEVYR